MASLTGVIIVNYNAGDALSRCVESVLAQGVPVRLAIIDNHSSDGSADTVASLHVGHEDVNVVLNSDNKGFARAVNQAAAMPGWNELEYLLILNPDCELFPGALETLIDALGKYPDAGMAGPLVVDRSGQAMRGTFRRFPDPWRSFLTVSGLWRLGRFLPAFEGVEPAGGVPLSTVPTEAVSGACMLVKQRLFRDAGGMDEAYGLHCEDLDLMYRLNERGGHCLFVPQARVYHQQGVSSRSRPVWVHWQKHRGMQRFYSKFQAAQHALPVRWLVVASIWLRFTMTLPLAMLRR